MAHKTSRRGGRPWWGKLEAKLAGRVTRRRDDRREAEEGFRVYTSYGRLGMREAHDQECLDEWSKFPVYQAGMSKGDGRCRHDTWWDPKAALTEWADQAACREEDR